MQGTIYIIFRSKKGTTEKKSLGTTGTLERLNSLLVPDTASPVKNHRLSDRVYCHPAHLSEPRYRAPWPSFHFLGPIDVLFIL